MRKDHIGILHRHSPRSKRDMQTWEKMLNRGGNFKMSMSTKVCSNHFAAGYCSDVCPISTLFLKSYRDEPTMKRKVPIGRTNIVSPPRKKRIYHRNGFDKIPLEEAQICTPYITEDESITTSGCARSETYIKCSNCFSKGKEIKELLLIISKQKHSILQLQVKLQKEKRIQIFDISDTQRNFSKLAKIYTSLQNKKFFWLALSIHHGEGWQFTLLSQAKKDKLLEN